MATSLLAIGAALLVAGMLARAGRRFEIPTIPLFVCAGIALGPHTPGLALVDRPGDLSMLATLGLVLLLFHLGMQCSREEIASTRGPVGRTAVLFLVANIVAGAALGLAFGWGPRESLIVVGAVAVSSSAIVTKLLTELGRMGRPETPIILGVIVIEDLFIALYLAVVEPLLSESSGIEIAASFAAALAFLALFGIATKYGTGLSRRLLETDNEELLTVCTVGAVVLVAGIAEEVGVSEAIASLLFGLLIAGAGLGARIERVVTPLSDTFGAMFFFVFGTSIRPHLIVDVLPEIALGALLSFVVNVGVGMLAARGSQLSRSSGLGTGLVVLSRGEFSLILAALATTAGLDQRVEAFIAGYVLTLSLLAPILAARSDRIARRFGWFARGDPGASAPSHNPGTG